MHRVMEGQHEGDIDDSGCGIIDAVKKIDFLFHGRPWQKDLFVIGGVGK